MSDFEEKQSSSEQNTDNTENFSNTEYTADENSTIFSDPSLHHDKVKKGVKLKKIITAVIALVAVVAVTVTVVLTVPVLKGGDTSSTDEIEPPIIDSSVFEANKINRVNLIRDDATIKFHLLEFDKVDDNGNATGETTEQWALVDVDRSLTSYSDIANTVSNFMEQSYTRKISDNKGDGSDYGFDDPEYQVDFYKDGETEVFLSLIIGDLNPTGSGRYATTSADDGVYYINGTMPFYYYQKNLLDFADPEGIPAISKDSDYSDGNFTDGQLIICDEIYFSGKNFGDETYRIISKENDNIKIFNTYHITSPVERPANDETMEGVVSLFSYGLTADGAYSFTSTDEDIKKFGLDKPDFTVTVKVAGIEQSFSATLQDDGDYAVYYEDNRTIMKVSADNLSVASYTRKDLFHDLLFIENISTVSKITVESGDETLRFDISTTYDETSARDVISSVKYQGTTLQTDNFRSYYSYLIGISAQSYEEHDTSELQPTTTVTIYHNDGTTPTVLKYYQITSSRYQCENNGVKMGLISSADHTRIMKYAKNVAADKTYNSR